MHVIQRVRRFAAAPAAALTLSAALAIPALTVASGSAMAGTSAPGTASPTVLAWGRNTAGQLGDGTATSTTTPVKVHLPAGTKVTQVRAGCADTLALTA